VTIAHIVYDIGSVLIHYDPELAYLDIIPDQHERRQFLDTVCTSPWNIEQDRGRSWQEAESLLISGFPDQELRIRAFRKNWHKMVPHAYEDSVAIMEGFIDAGHDVTMLTNFASDTFGEARERFPFLKRPRGVTVSGDIRLIKPDPRIFDLHTKTFGLERERTLFIDDNRANVDAARTHGWNAILFTGAADLRKELDAFGL